MRTSGLRTQRVGLVANPHAGRGEEAVARVMRDVFDHLAVGRWVVASQTLEEVAASDMGILHESVNCEGAARDARVGAEALLAAGIEVLVGIGGDGTMCDIAAAMRRHDRRVQLLGIGVGSANVGPLIGLRAEAVHRLADEILGPVTVHGIEAFVGSESLGVAFNDVALANSFFGTRDGRRIDLDAAAKLAGEDRTIEPASVCGPATWVAKNGQRMVENRSQTIAQIIASPVNNSGAHAGLAISGLLCWGPYVGKHAVLTAASAVMIRTKLAMADLEAVEPLRLVQLGFGDGDRLEIGGLADGAVVVMDGNPMRRLTPSDVVRLEARIDVIRTLRPGGPASAADE